MSRLDETVVRQRIQDPGNQYKVIRKDAGYLTNADMSGGGIVPEEESVKEGGPKSSTPFPQQVKVVMTEPDPNAPANEDGTPASRRSLHMFPTGDKKNKLQEIHNINPQKYQEVAQQALKQAKATDNSDYKPASADESDLEEPEVDNGIYNVPIEEAFDTGDSDETVERAAQEIETEREQVKEEGENEMSPEENGEPVDAWLSCNGMSMYTQYRDIDVNEREGFLVLFYKKGDTGLVVPQPGVPIEIRTDITEPGTYVFDKDIALPFGGYRACIMEQQKQQDDT